MDFDFGVVELILMVIMGLLAYLWKTQAHDVRQTTHDLNKLAIRFAEAKGGSEADKKTLFASIEELKEGVARIENHLLAEKKQ